MVTTSRPRQPQFMRRVQNRPALRRKGSLVVLAQLLLVASGVAVGGGIAYWAHDYIMNNSTFRLRRLLLDGVPEGLHVTVRQELASADNANLLLTDLGPLQARLRQVPQIRAATLRLVLPDAVEVYVELRAPWGRLQTLDGVFLISSDGVVLREAGVDDSELPRLRLQVDLASTLDARRRLPEKAPGARWLPAAVRIVDWMRTVAPRDLDRAELLLAEEGVFTLMDGWKILLGDDARLDAKAANLRAVLAGSPPAPGSVVDLRFRDMVVVRDPRPTDEAQE